MSERMRLADWVGFTLEIAIGLCAMYAFFFSAPISRWWAVIAAIGCFSAAAHRVVMAQHRALVAKSERLVRRSVAVAEAAAEARR